MRMYVLLFFLVVNRKITFVIDSSTLSTDGNMFLLLLNPFREQANFFCIDKQPFAFASDWVCIFGGSRNFTIRDCHRIHI